MADMDNNAVLDEVRCCFEAYQGISDLVMMVDYPTANDYEADLSGVKAAHLWQLMRFVNERMAAALAEKAEE